MYSSKIGRLGWMDLTVGDAEQVSAFYSSLLGWTPQSHGAEEYNDYDMVYEKEVIAGICHALGVNANLPPVWLPYINVESIACCIEACLSHGGSVVHGPRMMGEYQFCVIQDPAGAYMALISKGTNDLPLVSI
jgi:uncharacterized protein